MVSPPHPFAEGSLPVDAVTYASSLVTCHAHVHIGGVVVGLYTNTTKNLCHDWLSERAYISSDVPADIEVYLMDMDIADTPAWLIDMAKASAVGERLLSGSYVGLKWPDGACIVARHPVYCLWGRGLDGTWWRYLVKVFLSAYAFEHDQLHVKAACLSVEGQGVLIDGMSGAGKTTLLRRMIPMPGGAFVSNSHTLIEFAGRSIPYARGVLAKMRVRNISGADCSLPPGHEALELETGTYNLDPVWLFGERIVETVPVAAIVTLTPEKNIPARIRRLSVVECWLYYATFMTAIHRYYIREDLLEWLAWDPVQFHLLYEQNEQNLLKLLNVCPIFEISADLYNEDTCQSVYALLREICFEVGQRGRVNGIHH